MSDWLFYASVIILMLLLVFSSIIYRKLRLWKLFLLLSTYAFLVIARYFSDLIIFIDKDSLMEYSEYFLYFAIIVLAINFKSKIRITQNLTDYDFFELEKELDSIKDASELLRKRFIYTIGLLEEGLIFYDETMENLFLTEEVVKITGFKKPEITLDEYKGMIHKDDQNAYLHNIKKINKKVPELTHKYRLTINDSYTWIEEKGRMFSHGKNSYLISTVKKLDIRLFPSTSIEIIHSLPSEDDLIKVLSQYRKDKRTFYLTMMHLTNIPDINKRFGRDVGNLMIAEYIKQMKYHFARENNTVFRISGIQFAIIIEEEQKYNNLHRALVSGGDLINVRINIGGILQVVYPNIGILKNNPWDNTDVSELISLSNKALEEAIRNNKQNYSIFGG